MPYDYSIHVAELSDSETDELIKVSNDIKRAIGRHNGVLDLKDDRLSFLFRKRRMIMEGAESKVEVLRRLLQDERGGKPKPTLIYCSAKKPQQMEDVCRMLKSLNLAFARLTEEDSGRATEIIESFRRGDVRILVAKKILDEGFNIPEIERAFVLASNTSSREWIQRRGRILRRSPMKTHAELHDLVALPPETESGDRGLAQAVQAELRRAEEFERLARNRHCVGGPTEQITRIKTTWAWAYKPATETLTGDWGSYEEA